ncbi:DotU family type IV/VI secretion system protein [Aquitalea sp. ASV15]|uniref:DotU family type IV/VI secretion system protein n=1 Tax=Aquitalea sp. ASV15 TaxID=2795104 RepID=UPI0018EDBB03|nr:DotU/TssL family secretion system protein [Aquitalea sp. ASV15]
MKPADILHSVRGHMRDVALIVTRLNGQAEVMAPDRWQDHCLTVLDELDQQLAQSGAPASDRAQMIYAASCLLDETALRTLPEAQRLQWQATPLQVQRFGTLQGGEQVYEQISQALATPAPSLWLLACWQLVLALGFQGKYQHQDPAQRTQLIHKLDQSIGPIDTPVQTPQRKRRSLHWRSFSPWLWALLSCSLALIVYFLLQSWLHHAVSQLGS